MKDMKDFKEKLGIARWKVINSRTSTVWHEKMVLQLESAIEIRDRRAAVEAIRELELDFDLS